MKETGSKSYERDSVKQRFIEKFGKMLELSEIQQDGKERDKLFTMWPGNNIPLFPKFQFRDDGTLNPLFSRVLQIIYYGGNFYSPALICDKLFKADENGVRGIDLIQNGNRKKAIAWAKNFDNITLNLF